MPYAHGLLIAALALLATACGPVREAPPRTVERIVEVPVKVYVPIDPKYTRRPAIPEGPLREIPRVARERKKALEICYGNLETIEKLQGTPVPVEP